MYRLNGDFWSVESDNSQTEPEELASSEGEGEDSEGTGTLGQPPIPGFRRVPNQKGVGEGEVRLYCDVCQKSFTSPVDQPVVTCPEGHYPGEASEA